LSVAFLGAAKRVLSKKNKKRSLIHHQLIKGKQFFCFINRIVQLSDLTFWGLHSFYYVTARLFTYLSKQVGLPDFSWYKIPKQEKIYTK
jgi:hypothetical protein